MHIISFLINKYSIFGENSYEISTFFLFAGWGVFILRSIYFSIIKLIKKFNENNTFKFYLIGLIKSFSLSLLTFGSDIFGFYSLFLNITIFIYFNLFLILFFVKLSYLLFSKMKLIKNLISIILIISVSMISFSSSFKVNKLPNPVFEYYKGYSNLSKNSFDFIIEYFAKAITGREVTSRKDKFINEEQKKDIEKALKPGDILLRRMNWQLTNIGVGGFWTHSGMYLGNLEELNDFFNGIKELNGKDYSDWLKKEYPLIHDLILNDPDLVLYESNNKGVVLNKFDSMGESDFFSALRPVLSKSQIFTAIKNSFKYFGKNYDYKFNFHDDQELLCSELLYVAYSKTNLINFKPYYSMGKYYFKPDDFVKYYINHPNKLKFVIFYDSSEKEKKAFKNNEESFKKTLKRSPLDIITG